MGFREKKTTEERDAGRRTKSLVACGLCGGDGGSIFIVKDT